MLIPAGSHQMHIPTGFLGSWVCRFYQMCIPTGFATAPAGRSFGSHHERRIEKKPHRGEPLVVSYMSNESKAQRGLRSSAFSPFHYFDLLLRQPIKPIHHPVYLSLKGGGVG